MKIRFALVWLSFWSLALFLCVPMAASTSARSIDPLRDVQSIALDVVIGQPIRIDDPEAVPLFGDNHARAEAFRGDLRSRLGEILRQQEIDINEESIYTLSLSFYGGSSSGNGAGCRGVLLLKVAIVAQPDIDRDAEVLYERGVLAGFDPEMPEAALTLAAEAVLEEIIVRHRE